MTKKISIVWFRQDLRISDNPAVAEASSLGKILPIYILDNCAPDPFKIGETSKIWLHHSLNSLNKSLDGKLNIYIGKTSEIIELLIDQYSVSNLFCNACYEPWHIKQESNVKDICKRKSINYQLFNSSYLWNPSQILKSDGSYYKIFTAYKKKSYQSIPRKIIKNTTKINAIVDSINKTSISDLNLIPHDKKWHQKILRSWKIGESAAHIKLHNFIENQLSGYKNGRNYPVKNHTSLYRHICILAKYHLLKFWNL